MVASHRAKSRRNSLNLVRANRQPNRVDRPASVLVEAGPRIGLALGGGGARGLAHVVVLETLDELGLKPSIIAGTSIGALLGAAYALGHSGQQIRAMTEETLGRRFDLVRQLFAARSDPVQKLLRLLPLRSSLLNSAALLELLVPEVDNRLFSDLSIPLKVLATDLASHEAVIIESGSLKQAVAASIAIPVLFTPVQHEGRILVDGGLVNPLPFEVLTGLVDVTIAIDVSGASKGAAIEVGASAIEVAMQSVQILQKSITRHKLELRRPDVYIDVDVDRFGALEFWRPREIFAAAAPVKERLKRELDRVLTELDSERDA